MKRKKTHKEMADEIIANYDSQEALWMIWDVIRHVFKEQNRYSRLIPTGGFGMYDYGAGLLHMSLCIHIKRVNEDKWGLMLAISTADDGVWQAFGPEESNVEAKKRMAKAAELLDEINVLPTEKEFNRMLIQVGMHGMFTG